MFHRADGRLRAWLAARASAGARAPQRVAAEIDRLGALLRDRERERAALEAARLAAIDELQRALDASEQVRTQLLDRVGATKAKLARAEREREALRRDLAASEADREARLLYIRHLETALEARRLEAERWRSVLPRVKVRAPRWAAVAARLRRLGESLRARFGGSRREAPNPNEPG